MTSQRILPAVILAVLSAEAVQAAISFDGQTAYTQNFNTLAATGTSNTWTDDSTLTGWYALYTANSTVSNGTASTNAVVSTYRADAGSNSASLMSLGTGTSTDRAFGGRGGAAGSAKEIRYGLALTNVSSSTIDSLDVSYLALEYRTGGGGTDVLNFSWEVFTNLPGTSMLDTGAYTIVAALGNSILQTSPVDTPLDPPVTQTVTGTLSGLNWEAGSYLVLRWSDPNIVGNDATMGIDNLSVSVAAVPELATVGLLGLPMLGLLMSKSRRRSWVADEE